MVMLDETIAWIVAVLVGLLTLVVWMSLVIEFRKPKRKLSFLLLNTFLCFLFTSAFLNAAESASQASFSAPQKGYVFSGWVNPEHLSQKLGMIDMCEVSDSPESKLCMFLLRAKLNNEPGPSLLVLQNETSYLVRSGNWPFDSVVEIPKSRITL